MPTITADSAMAASLAGAKAFTAIRDSQGRFLGMFAPGSPEEIRLYLHAWMSLDPEELRKQKARKGKTHKLADVLERLKAMEAP